MIVSHKDINFQVILAANPTVMYMGRSYEAEAHFDIALLHGPSRIINHGILSSTLSLLKVIS